MLDPMENSTDTSLSFLDPVSKLPAPAEAVKLNSFTIPPGVVDEAFINYSVEIPSKLARLFRQKSEIKLLYKIVEGDYLAFMRIDGPEEPFRIYVEDFGEFPLAGKPPTRLVFAIGRRAWMAAEKAAERKEFKASLQAGVSYEGNRNIKDKRMGLIKYQIDYQCNIAYIDDCESLHRELKNIAKALVRETRPTPRMKNRGSEEKGELFLDVLKCIPGVSTGVAQGIARRYGGFKALCEALRNRRDEVVGLEVMDETGQHKRVLGEKLFKKLESMFITANQE